MSEANPATADRILEGALRALGRHGVDKLRMSAVSAAAGVSRGTLYRYFPTKDDLLGALVHYEQQRFRQALGEAIAAADDPAARLDVVLDLIFSYLREHPALRRLLDDEPGFVLDHLRAQLPFLRRSTERVLGDVLRDAEVVRCGAASTAQVVEILLRLLISNFLVPARRPEELMAGFKAWVGLPAEDGRRAPARRSPVGRRVQG